MSQTITPELRTWIVQQAQAGCTPEAVLQAMLRAGWNEDVALAAMEQTLQEHVASLPAAAQAPVAPRPQLALREGAHTIDAGDRIVHVLATLRRPRLAVLGNVLAPEECDALMRLAEPRLKRSRTVQTATGGEELNADRTSDGMFFRRGETPLIQRIEARLSRLVQWPVENGEGLQVLRYRPGAQYKPHYDYFDPRAPGTPRITARGGQRVATLVMYLSEPVRGGGTTFPDIGLEVLPQRGGAVFFAYDRPDPATLTLHGGAPVLEGEKWVATKWLRETEFTP
ncbi:MAG: 2OG-Fe(II) oxygenase [Tepidimonas ignava]|uniref:2OG-Fe(II) oxygenase superfamily protein n=1 Tax=Tepidimonas ignava TaxID=114249 RepID=A0A4R3LFI1_9BURK|nr:2OG-Fe(II) oxygenase [Tepidimonas ignava]TCS97134.1 prolyl 4-hydroxylase [Tepidimonas ignava]TSE22368.1 2OG-Fe(II) oxygenase superfamily protein [Tepidimonas ignava]